jgi:hypothetical protein
MLSHAIIDFTEPRQNLRLHHAREECATENCLKRGVHPIGSRTVGLNPKLFPGTPQTKKALSMSMSEIKVAMSASAE